METRHALSCPHGAQVEGRDAGRGAVAPLHPAVAKTRWVMVTPTPFCSPNMALRPTAAVPSPTWCRPLHMRQQPPSDRERLRIADSSARFAGSESDSESDLNQVTIKHVVPRIYMEIG